MSTAPNLADLPHLPATHDRGLKVFAAPVGGRNSVANLAREALIAETARFRRGAAEARAHLPLPSQRSERIGEMSGAVVQKMRAAAKAYAEENARVSNAAKLATAVPAYGDSTAYYTVDQDSRLVDRLYNMEPTQRAALLGQTMKDPASNQRLAEAILRQHPMLAGISPAEHDQLRMTMLKAMRPDVAFALETEQTQIAHLREALAVCGTELREQAPGAWSEMQVVAPEVGSVLTAPTTEGEQQ